MKNRKVLLASLIEAAVVVAVGLLVGWEWGLGAMAGLGSGLGAWIGVRYGNKKATEVDQYREECWVNARNANLELAIHLTFRNEKSLGRGNPSRPIVR